MKNDKTATKSCSFFGHRNINITNELTHKIRRIVQDLIINHNVLTFLFGSKSEFDSLCRLIVESLKQDNPKLKRIAYTCKNEVCFLEEEKEKWEKIYSQYTKSNFHLLCVDEVFDFKDKYCSGKSSYIKRNQAMIDDSDFCIFYYDNIYKPKMRKFSKCSYGCYQPKSGTKLAYEYAVNKNKTIFNIKTLL